MKPSTLVRLALAGTRTDTLRVLLTGMSAALAALAILAALTVLAIPAPPADEHGWVAYSEHYTNALLREPGLRPGVAFALVLLTIPVLALAGQCARLGAPARDRRLAALRLAGAAPRQTVAIAAAETGLASLLGSTLGLGIYLFGRQLLHRPNAEGQLPLPTDVLPPAGALAAVVLGLPLLAALVAVIMMRRVVITPFGVVRRQRRERAPRPWPGVLIALGVAAIVAIQPLMLWYASSDQEMPGGLLLVLLFGGGLLAALGVVLGTGWISYTVGRVLHRFARRPAALLSARRLMADPWTSSRTLAALLVCVLFGAGAAGFRSWFVTQAEVEQSHARLAAVAMAEEYHESPVDNFYLHTMDLVDIAVIVALVIAVGGLMVTLAEGIVARRRAYAALVATGVPRPVLGRAVLWQSLAPAVPAVLLALAVGVLLARGFLGDEVRSSSTGFEICEAGPELCDNPITREQYARLVEVPAVTRTLPVPFDDLALFGAGALAAVLVTVGIGLLFLRSSTALEELRVG
ncbi:MAG TPA: FtsX-like permease family protein [Micromonosporaceae bacterium]|nr:FtsX-like permease family protein [Micromonosporaceae bacterium]